MIFDPLQKYSRETRKELLYRLNLDQGYSILELANEMIEEGYKDLDEGYLHLLELYDIEDHFKNDMHNTGYSCLYQHWEFPYKLILFLESKNILWNMFIKYNRSIIEYVLFVKNNTHNEVIETFLGKRSGIHAKESLIKTGWTVIDYFRVKRYLDNEEYVDLEEHVLNILPKIQIFTAAWIKENNLTYRSYVDNTFVAFERGQDAASFKFIFC